MSGEEWALKVPELDIIVVTPEMVLDIETAQEDILRGAREAYVFLSETWSQYEEGPPTVTYKRLDTESCSPLQ